MHTNNDQSRLTKQQTPLISNAHNCTDPAISQCKAKTPTARQSIVIVKLLPPSLQTETLTLLHRTPKLSLQHRRTRIAPQHQHVETRPRNRIARLLLASGTYAIAATNNPQHQARRAHSRNAVRARDKREQLALPRGRSGRESRPEPSDHRFVFGGVWEQEVGRERLLPVFVDGDGAQGVYVERFVGAADEELDFFRAEEAEGVAGADGEEAALEGLELARDGAVEEIADVEVDELGAVDVRDWCVCAVRFERVVDDCAIALDGNHERPAVGRLNVTREIE